MSYVYSVRIAFAGRHFPFERVYLCKQEDLPRVESLFRYALILPMTDFLRTALFSRQTPPKLITRTHARSAHEEPADTWSKLREAHDLRVVVPFNAVKTTRRKRYLRTAAWQTRKRAPFVDVFDAADSYVISPAGKRMSICSTCPNQLARHAGDCTPGDETCLQQMQFPSEDELYVIGPPPGKDARDEDLRLLDTESE